jgi:hypothetical protein
MNFNLLQSDKICPNRTSAEMEFCETDVGTNPRKAVRYKAFTHCSVIAQNLIHIKGSCIYLGMQVIKKYKRLKIGVQRPLCRSCEGG